jgi:succinate dehydrogenase/fumarate reductase flavoprotein subunit
MTIRRELIDELLKEYESPQEILGEGGLLKDLTKAVIERCLQTELDSHLGYAKYCRQGHTTSNTRNGQSQQTLKGEQGHLDIEIPRDRQSTFESQLVKKGQTRFEGFDDKILALYARGMTTRDIQAQLQEVYGVEVSPTLISSADRGGERRSAAMANASARSRLSDCLRRLFGGQSARESAGHQQIPLPGAGCQSERLQGIAGDVAGSNRRRQILARGADRGAKSRAQGHLHCLCGWSHRLTRSH